MFDIDSCAFFITNKTSKQLADKVNEKLMTAGSTRVQWLVIYYLERDGKMNQSELANKMNLKASTVVRLIDRMQKDGIVERIKDSQDRRVTYVHLTKKGEQKAEELFPIAIELSELFSRGISDEEFEVFNRVLNKMYQNVEENN